MQSGDPYQQPPGYPVSTPPGYPVSPGYPAYPVSPYVQPMPVMPVVQVFQPQQTSGFAVASLVLSIVGLVFGCCSFGVPSLFAVIFGHLGLAETKAGRKAGGGMAVAGLVMGYIVLLPAVLLSIWFVFAGGLAAMQEPTY